MKITEVEAIELRLPEPEIFDKELGVDLNEETINRYRVK